MSDTNEPGDRPVLVERRGAVSWITINRPERRNALNRPVFEGIQQALREATTDGDVRAIVLTGAGEAAFCAGADLQGDDGNAPFAFDFSRPDNPMTALFRQFEECPIPTIARVNGHVLAGGMGLLGACDMAVAVEDALVGVPEVKVGLVPAMVLSYLLRLVPRRKLYEMVLTGEPWTAREAEQLGLLNYVVPQAELDTKLDWLLSRVLDKSPAAVRMGKNAIRYLRDMTLEQAFGFSQSYIQLVAQTQDAREGIRAFQEKRPPNWTGR